MQCYQQRFVLGKRCGVCFLCMLCLSYTFHHSIEESPLHFCIIKLTSRDKKEPRSKEINRMEITRTKQNLQSHLCPCDLYYNILLWKTIMANNE